MDLIDSLETMLAQGRDGALLRYGLGNEYHKRRQYTSAIAHLRQAVALDPQYSAAWKLLGVACADAGDAVAAAEAYTRGIAVAEAKGDIQAAKEMRVFLKRLKKGAE